MASSYVFAVEGLPLAGALEDLDPKIIVAARAAVNRTIDRARAASSRAIRSQVNFSASYLSGQDGRLVVSKRASGRELEGVITGRQRPTSLARFATTAPGGARGRGVRVSVKPGTSELMKRAFFLKLRAGRAPIDTKYNMGLAIRLKAGEQLQNKHRVIRLKGNLFLLFGPSVDQVFRTVAQDILPDMSDFMAGEFLRLLDVDLPQ